MKTTKNLPLADNESLQKNDIDDLVHRSSQPEQPTGLQETDADDLIHAMPPAATSPEQDPDDAIHVADTEIDEERI
jgi:hypothetical protein